MSRRGGPVLLVVAAGLITACTLLTSVEGLSGPEADAGSLAADASDASRERSAEDAPPDAGTDAADAAVRKPNIHPNGTFDLATAPWGAYQGTIASDPTARSGAKSLRVCTSADAPDLFTADDGGPIPHVAGRSYRAEVWVRSAPDAPPPPLVFLTARTIVTAPGFTPIEIAESKRVSLTDVWQRLEVTFMPTKSASALNLFIGGPPALNACFLLDDVYVEAL